MREDREMLLTLKECLDEIRPKAVEIGLEKYVRKIEAALELDDAPRTVKLFREMYEALKDLLLLQIEESDRFVAVMGDYEKKLAGRAT